MSYLKTAINATTQTAAQASLVNGQASGIKAKGGDGDDMIALVGHYNNAEAGNGDDQVIIVGNYNTVWDDDGNNAVYIDGNENGVNLINGNQTIQSNGNKNLINAGRGSHAILFTGDENDVSFGDGDTSVYFWGNKNAIVGDNGNHTVKTLDWLIVDEKDANYAGYAALMDKYGVATDNTKVNVTNVNTVETTLAKANGPKGSAAYHEAAGEPVISDPIVPTNEMLIECLSPREKALAQKLDLSEELDNGKPRYIFALGSQDKQVHLYDMLTESTDEYGICIDRSLDVAAGNYELHPNDIAPKRTEDGTGTYVTYQNVDLDYEAYSGTYSDLLKFGKEIYMTTLTQGTVTDVTGSIDYDFSAMDNSISLGDGASTVRYTGSGVISYGDALVCGEDPSVKTRGGFTMDMTRRIENLAHDYLYTLSGSIDTQKLWSMEDGVLTSSPLIVDYNKDGQVSAAAGFGVDVNNDGKADGAAVNGDKMLAMSDRNGNGKIDGTEVFGDKTVNPFTGKAINAANGFEALKEIAKSAEQATGIKCMNNQDVDLQALKAALAMINVDLGFISGNNVTELEDLAHVKSINVANYTEQKQSGAVQHNQIGSYTDTEGNIFATHDVWFRNAK